MRFHTEERDDGWVQWRRPGRRRNRRQSPVPAPRYRQGNYRTSPEPPPRTYAEVTRDGPRSYGDTERSWSRRGDRYNGANASVSRERFGGRNNRSRARFDYDRDGFDNGYYNNQQRPNYRRYGQRKQHKNQRYNNNQQQHFNPRPRQQARYVPQNRRYFNTQPPRPQSDDPRFVDKIRLLHKLIKAIHHSAIATAKSYPPAVQKIQNHLATVIKPAHPTDRTTNLIAANAQNWAYNTMLVLQEHYDAAIAQILQELTLYSPDDLKMPFEIATKWARRNLGRRLKQETLDQAQTLITPNPAPAQQQRGSPTTAREEPEESPPPSPSSTASSSSSPSVSPPAPQTRTLRTQTSPPVTQTEQQTRGETPQSPPLSITGEHTDTSLSPILAQYLRDAGVEMGTMTDPQRGDWSPDRPGTTGDEDFNSQEPTSTPETPLQQGPPPLQQRTATQPRSDQR
ncbi:uncharacterized protein LOC106511507, partial [Austrofundulus limnaeus]|uniref:Uncharacterized protein LOC106511507 n=1 Tax=Austrofundulus limnaeus TaxID=52670 RepID=A0A2I4AJL8_AUSLI